MATRLMFVEIGAELHMPFSFGEILIEFQQPTGVISVQIFVELIKNAEVRARWTSNDQQWFIPKYNVPSSFAVTCLVKVESIG